MNLVESLLRALEGHGARAIFGIPGDYALPMFKVMENSEVLPLYTLSHEPGVGFAADAAARISEGIGVAAVTFGAGALNLLNAVAAAYVERSPLVVISAAPPKHHAPTHLGFHHQVRSLNSQFRLFREVTCSQAVLDDPEPAPGLIARTLSACVEKSLPVYIEIPMDAALQPCGRVMRRPPYKADQDAVAECAGEIAKLIQQAKQPVLMVGVEVRRFGIEEEVTEFVRRSKIPTVSSLMARGVAAGHPAQLSKSYLGLAGDPESSALVEDSDCLILLGVILSDTNLGIPVHRLDFRRMIHAFNGDVRIAHHHYPNVPLRDLVLELSKHAAAIARDNKEHLKISAPRRRFVADGLPAAPSDIAAAINELFAQYGPMPLASDIGDSLFVALEIDYVDLVAQGCYASMGFAVPAAIGIQAVTRKRPVVLVGDGAFQMTGWELGNCQRYGFDPIVVVLNSRSWEMLRVYEPTAKFNRLSDWHFADMASSLGGNGRRVTSRAEVAAALETAWHERGKFQIIEVMLPDGATSDTLRRFVAGLGKRFQVPVSTKFDT